MISCVILVKANERDCLMAPHICWEKHSSSWKGCTTEASVIRSIFRYQKPEHFNRCFNETRAEEKKPMRWSNTHHCQTKPDSSPSGGNSGENFCWACLQLCEWHHQKSPFCQQAGDLSLRWEWSFWDQSRQSPTPTTPKFETKLLCVRVSNVTRSVCGESEDSRKT